MQEFTKSESTIAGSDTLRRLRNEVEAISYRLDPGRTIVIGKATF